MMLKALAALATIANAAGAGALGLNTPAPTAEAFGVLSHDLIDYFALNASDWTAADEHGCQMKNIDVLTTWSDAVRYCRDEEGGAELVTVADTTQAEMVEAVTGGAPSWVMGHYDADEGWSQDFEGAGLWHAGGAGAHQHDAHLCVRSGSADTRTALLSPASCVAKHQFVCRRCPAPEVFEAVPEQQRRAMTAIYRNTDQGRSRQGRARNKVVRTGGICVSGELRMMLPPAPGVYATPITDQELAHHLVNVLLSNSDVLRAQDTAVRVKNISVGDVVMGYSAKSAAALCTVLNVSQWTVLSKCSERLENGEPMYAITTTCPELVDENGVRIIETTEWYVNGTSAVGTKHKIAVRLNFSYTEPETTPLVWADYYAVYQGLSWLIRNTGSFWLDPSVRVKDTSYYSRKYDCCRAGYGSNSDVYTWNRARTPCTAEVGLRTYSAEYPYGACHFEDPPFADIGGGPTYSGSVNAEYKEFVSAFMASFLSCRRELQGGGAGGECKLAEAMADIFVRKHLNGDQHVATVRKAFPALGNSTQPGSIVGAYEVYLQSAPRPPPLGGLQVPAATAINGGDGSVSGSSSPSTSPTPLPGSPTAAPTDATSSGSGVGHEPGSPTAAPTDSDTLDAAASPTAAAGSADDDKGTTAATIAIIAVVGGVVAIAVGFAAGMFSATTNLKGSSADADDRANGVMPSQYDVHKDGFGF